MTPLEALNHAIDSFGAGVGGFAAQIGATQTAVSNWRSRLQEGKQRAVPAEWCPVIERATGVRCELLNPGVDWAYLRSRPVGASGHTGAEAPPEVPTEKAA